MKQVSGTLLIQRVIPHYRVELFSQLYGQYGVKVVTAESPPAGSFMNLADPRGLPFAIPAPFHFPDPSNPFRANVPTARIMDEFRPQCVIAEFGMRMSSTYALSWMRRIGRVPRLAFWGHGWQMERGFASTVDRLVQGARLPLYATADAVATYTEEGAEWVRGRLPHKPVVAIGNALDTGSISRLVATRAATRLGRPQLLAVGRLTDDKGFDKALDVFQIIRNAFPDAALTIIGDGPERGRLEARARELEMGGISFLGALYEESHLAAHFLGADILILPGAAGLSVNHALAYGLPIIAFARSQIGPRHHPEIEYVIDGLTGILVGEPTAQAMASALIDALNQGRIDQLKVRIRLSDDIPSIEKMVANFSKLLKILDQ